MQANSWDKIAGERVRAYGAFLQYLAMGERRTLNALAEMLGISYSRLTKWSSIYDWSTRANDYDVEQRRLALKAAEQARAEMNQRQIDLGRELQSTARKAIRKLYNASGELSDELRPADIARLADIGTKLERLARGEPTENVKNEHTGGVKVLRLPARAITIEEWEKTVQETNASSKVILPEGE